MGGNFRLCPWRSFFFSRFLSTNQQPERDWRAWVLVFPLFWRGFRGPSTSGISWLSPSCTLPVRPPPLRHRGRLWHPQNFKKTPTNISPTNRRKHKITENDTRTRKPWTTEHFETNFWRLYLMRSFLIGWNLHSDFSKKWLEKGCPAPRRGVRSKNYPRIRIPQTEIINKPTRKIKKSEV